jgi:hypothetical protein
VEEQYDEKGDLKLFILQKAQKQPVSQYLGYDAGLEVMVQNFVPTYISGSVIFMVFATFQS